ncbi:hypothetical protein ACFOY4_11005 [Actinomadura syzygii]|uniref:non-specific serine/threonine protein kinase n=1 Tax=Actinomadura syzygii TaxID=1427538 RepID=A0A5D0U5P7_9ACTN|nr:hypothetical protein [Actinomadura syzygii]TYC13294.1 hypothetical protein FXF65_22645 [Actinomadura syzygii]
MRLTERYLLVERLDRGGTTEVWRARDELLGLTVAVKLPAARSAATHRAFQQGVGRAAGLTHPALETVYDSDRARGRAGRAVSYAVTEFLDGGTLADLLRHGPLSVAEAADVAERVAGALDAAHAAGIAHGRLSPRKVMLVDGDAKVIGLGAGGGPASGADMAADVRALGALISACLPSGTSGGPAPVAALCLDATPADGPSAAKAAALLQRGPRPVNAAFGPPTAFAATQRIDSLPDQRPSRDHRTRVLRPPRRKHGAGARLAAFAVVAAIPVTAGVAVLASGPRTPVVVPATTASVQTPRRGTGRVASALGRMRPIVSRGYAAGEIRSDVAIDLDAAIADLANDLAADRKVDVNRRVGLLRARIDARRRERGLSPDVADQLTRVLATARA